MEGEGGEGMIVSGWNNGSPDNRTGAGYGIRLSKEDRGRVHITKTYKSKT